DKVEPDAMEEFVHVRHEERAFNGEKQDGEQKCAYRRLAGGREVVDQEDACHQHIERDSQTISALHTGRLPENEDNQYATRQQRPVDRWYIDLPFDLRRVANP